MSALLDQELFAVGWGMVWKVAAVFAVAWLCMIVFRRFRRYSQVQNAKIRGQLRREASFSDLGNKLNAATTRISAARIIVDTAQELFGWHASTLKLYDCESNYAESIINFDTIDGKIQEVEPPAREELVSPIMQQVFREGAKLILRQDGAEKSADLVAFGDKQRRSASLMFVPIRDGTRPTGMLSIQSYLRNAYTQGDLNVLQKLADHCGGALERIRAQELVRQAHDELERRVAERTAELANANKLLREEVENHQKTEAALCKEQHLFQSFMETVPDSIYFKDRDGRFIRVNNAKLKRLQLRDASEIVGKTDFDFFAKEHAERMSRDEEKIVRDGQPLIGKEEQITHLDGAGGWMLTTKMPLRNESGAIVGTFGISRDITRQKKAEQAFSHSQHLLETLMNQVPDYIYFKDLGGRFTRVNRAFANQFGNCEPHQVVGKTDFDFLSSEAAKESHEDEQRIIRTGQPMFGKEEHEIWIDGREWWVLTSKMPFRDEVGRIIGTFGVTRDITQRKAAEELLQRSQQELEKRVAQRTGQLTAANEQLRAEIIERMEAEVRSATFSNLGYALSAANQSEEAARTVLEVADQFFGWDASYLHLFTSTEPQRIIPILTYDLVQGKRVAMLRDRAGQPLSDRDRKLIESGAELVLREDSAEESKGFVRFGDQGRPSLSLMFVPIRNGTEVIGAMSIQSYSANAYNENDLATLQALADFCAGALERIQVQEALRESEERFSKAFRSSPVPLSLSILQDGRYVDVNDRMVQLLGHSREEMIGHTSTELRIWPIAKDREKMLAAISKARSVRDMKVDLRTKSGQLRQVLLSVEVLDFGGEPLLLVGVYDVTERLQLEERLRQSQKMEAFGQLAAGVAHDFNNILTIIQGHATLLLESQGFAGAVREALEQVNAAADRAANLTKQLLAFSRRQVMQPKALDLNEVVATTSKMLHRILGENISLHLNPAPALPRIHGDLGMIEQVLVNLALNARDAMPKGGKLIISTDAITVDDEYVEEHSEARAGDFVRVTVVDTGSGMDEATAARMFEPFFTTKEVGKGTGLGLATVYGIVQQHEGWIDVSTAPGAGATFRIYLPATTMTRSTPSNKNLPEVAGGQETILLVEDEPALRALVRSILEIYGYRVIDAAHGKEAIELWREKREEIDLLLTDIVMPEGISGIELAQSLKKDKPGLRVVYTSGYSVDLLKENQKLNEDFDFIAKPYQPRVLASTIRTCLDAREQ